MIPNVQGVFAMRKTILIVAALCWGAAPALAEGHEATQPVVVVEAPPPTGSINSGYIFLGALALLIVAVGDF